MERAQTEARYLLARWNAQEDEAGCGFELGPRFVALQDHEAVQDRVDELQKKIVCIKDEAEQRAEKEGKELEEWHRREEKLLAHLERLGGERDEAVTEGNRLRDDVTALQKV